VIAVSRANRELGGRWPGLRPDSALAFLLLEQLGHKKVSLLSDSVDDWGFAGLPLDKAATPASQRKYPATIRTGLVTRDPAETTGLYPKVYIASGKSLPAKLPEGKVIHVPYADLVNANGTPRAAKDIWEALVKAGVPRYAEIISFSDDPGEAARFRDDGIGFHAGIVPVAPGAPLPFATGDVPGRRDTIRGDEPRFCLAPRHAFPVRVELHRLAAQRHVHRDLGGLDEPVGLRIGHHLAALGADLVGV